MIVIMEQLAKDSNYVLRNLKSKHRASYQEFPWGFLEINGLCLFFDGMAYEPMLDQYWYVLS